MSKQINFFVFAFSLHILLSGCPYKEVYRSTLKNISNSGLQIYPETVYYIEKKDSFSATFGFNISNTTNNTVTLGFDSAFLNHQNIKVNIDSVIYVFGKLLDPRTVLVICPKADSTIALEFNGKLPPIKGDIMLNLYTKMFNVVIPYQRVTKK